MSVTARVAVSDDLPAIRELAASGTSLLGNGDVEFLMERATLVVLAVKEDESVCGFLAVFDTLGDVQGDVAAWVENEMAAKGYSMGDTLWARQLIAGPGAEGPVCKAMLREAFNGLPRMARLGAAAPKEVPAKWGLKGLFDAESAGDAGTLHISKRAMVVPPLLVRKARVEDHDDLLPVLERARKQLGALAILPDGSGPDEPFALARLISSQDEDHVVLVAENDGGELVGMLALTSEVNVRQLQESYELEPYYGLVEPVDEPDPEPTPEPEPEPEPAAESEAAADVAEGGEGEAGGEGDEDGAAAGAEAEDATEGEAPASSGPAEGEAVEGGEGEGEGEGKGEVPATPPPAIKDPTPTPPPPPPPVDDGLPVVSTAFAVSMFCLDAEYAAQGSEFLAPALECFPEKDYVVMTLPNDSAEPVLLRVFSRIPTRPLATTPEVFYLFHRYALLTSFEVRAATAADVDGVAELVRGFPNTKDIFSSFEAALITSTAMVALCEGEVIGFSTLVASVDVGILRANFSLEDYITMAHHKEEEHAEVDFFVINPIFAHKRRLFLLEIMRLLNKSVLYFAMPAGEAVPEVLVTEFNQVAGRHHAGLKDNAVDFALYVFTHKLSAHFRSSVNSRIVVVGSSDTALALLERLLLDRDLSFNYLTLVSPDGFNVAQDASSEYTPSLLAKLGIPTRVRLVDKWMVGLDRANRVIYLDDDSQVPYESLVIAAGLQDQTRARLELEPNDPYPVVALADVLEMDDAEVSALDSVIVYGATVEAYTALTQLQDMGLDPSCVEHIVPPGPVSAAARALIAAAGDRLPPAEPMRLVGHEPADGDGSVALIFEDPAASTPEEPTITRTAALAVACDEPSIDVPLFHCLNDASIVFDGAVVVDASFRTNDPSIFAAGALAKFSRRYGRGLCLKHFNSREVGRAVAGVLADLYGGLGPSEELPALRAATATKCRLPGGDTFAFAAMPSMIMAPAGPHPDGWKVLESIGDEGIPGDFSLTLDATGSVAAVTYCGALDMDTGKLACLAGLHKSYLKGMVEKYEAGERKDLLTMATEAWADALYLDKFAGVRAMLLSHVVEDAVAEAGADADAMVMAGAKGMVQDVILEMVFQGANDLPRYNLPGVGA